METCKSAKDSISNKSGEEASLYDFSTIPVVVLTTSKAEQDVLRSYELRANCYITKPVDFANFLEVIHSIEKFWLAVVTLPGMTQTAKDGL